MKEALQQLISQTITTLIDAEKIPAMAIPAIKIERTRDASHGDFACNIALVLAKPAAMKPRDIAELICQSLPDNTVIANVDIAGPGFINVFLAKSAQTDVVVQVLNEAEHFGHNQNGMDDKGVAKSVQVEFVSANPTGPLHVGHGRGAAVGDSICRLLEASGWQVTR